MQDPRRENGGLAYASGRGGKEKGIKSVYLRCILEEEPMGLAEELDVRK